MNENGKMFRVSKWVPSVYLEGEHRFFVDCDLTNWVLHFDQRGIKTEIRHRATDGKISLWREGQDSFPSDAQD